MTPSHYLTKGYLASVLGVGAYMLAEASCPYIEVHKSWLEHGGTSTYKVPLWRHYWSSEARLEKVMDQFTEGEDTSPTWETTFSLYPRGRFGYPHPTAIRAIARSMIGDNHVIADVRVPEVNNNDETVPVAYEQ